MSLFARLRGKSENAIPVSANEGNFNDLVTSSRYVVVDFWSRYCPPCDAMDPVIKRLAKEYRGRVLFLKVSVTSNPQIAERFRVKSVPAFLFFVNGKLKARRVGAVSYENFKKWLNGMIED